MRASRNSAGPLVSWCLRRARSSGGAVVSLILLMAVLASSFARAALAGDGCLAFGLMVSPSSTSRRMASDSVGVSGCFSAQLTIAARILASARKPIRGVTPVGGRPMTLCLTRELEAGAIEIRMRATRRLDQLRQAQKETV